MSETCPREPAECNRGYCQRMNECAEIAAGAPAPIVVAEGRPRYHVTKESGSQWARVIDRETGLQVKRFDIFRGNGKYNGWELADALCAHLNKESIK